MQTLSPPDPRTSRPVDPLLAQRLASLPKRRGEEPTRVEPKLAVVERRRPVGKRARPARASKAAALALSTLTTIGLGAMFAQDAQANASSVLVVAEPATTATTATTLAATTATTAAAATTVATAAGIVADGSYVGDAASNRWGTVQVQVVYSGGQITDVQILSYPDGDRKSVSINEGALPTLIGASITAQSADVDTVSGATYTSVSYRESLQSAIDAALAASVVAG